MRFVHTLILASVCSLPLILQGAAPTTQDADANGRIVRTYDVSDVLTVERDYPLTASMIPSSDAMGPPDSGGGGGRGGGGMSGGGFVLPPDVTPVPPPVV